MGGALRLAHEKYKCLISFSGGEVFSATSNLRSQRLRECLLKWNMVSSEQVAAIDEGLSDLDFSNQALQLNVLNADALERALVRQAEDVLRPALLWTEGDWAYDPQLRVSNSPGIQLDASGLAIEGARRLPPEL